MIIDMSEMEESDNVLEVLDENDSFSFLSLQRLFLSFLENKKLMMTAEEKRFEKNMKRFSYRRLSSFFVGTPPFARICTARTLFITITVDKIVTITQLLLLRDYRFYSSEEKANGNEKELLSNERTRSTGSTSITRPP